MNPGSTPSRGIVVPPPDPLLPAVVALPDPVPDVPDGPPGCVAALGGSPIAPVQDVMVIAAAIPLARHAAHNQLANGRSVVWFIMTS